MRGDPCAWVVETPDKGGRGRKSGLMRKDYSEQMQHLALDTGSTLPYAPAKQN
jgi:hypothetical protein